MKMPWETNEFAGVENVTDRLLSYEAWINWMNKFSPTTKLVYDLLSEHHLQELHLAFEACRPVDLQPLEQEQLNGLIEEQFDLPMDGPDSAIDNTRTCILCKADITDEPNHKCELKEGKNERFEKLQRRHAAWRERMKPEFDAIQAAHNISPEALTRRIG